MAAVPRLYVGTAAVAWVNELRPDWRMTRGDGLLRWKAAHGRGRVRPSI
jgi:hypothetical protein